MSGHNGAPRPAQHPVNDRLHPDERFPGLNYPYELTPPPYNADAEPATEQDPRREDPGFLKQVGEWAIKLATHVGRTIRHYGHRVAEDAHETTEEAFQAFNRSPGTGGAGQRHLRNQQLAQLQGNHPSVANTPFAGHQRHGVGATLKARLDRVDTPNKRVGIVADTVVPAEEVIEDWPEAWQSFIDPRNIIKLRDCYLGMPMGNIDNLSTSPREGMESRLSPIRAGGFKRLPEALQRAYLGMARGVVIDSEGPHDYEGAHFLALLDYIDRGLRASVIVPNDYKQLEKQITDEPIEADRGITDRLNVYTARKANHVYDYPEPWTRFPSGNREQQLLDRLMVLDQYLGNFYRMVKDRNDRDWDLAEPYYEEYIKVRDQLGGVPNGRRTR